MAHRTVLDLLIGRHYCPACGKAAGFRPDDSYDKTKLSWYRFARVRLFCNACGVAVRGTLRPGVWIALPMWLLFAGGGMVGIIQYGLIASGGGQIALLALLFLVGACMIQVFLHYEIAIHAP